MNTKICDNCNKPFTKKWPYLLKKARFCSTACSSAKKWSEIEFTAEHKAKLLAGRAKYKYTPEMRLKMSQIKKAQFADGQKTWNKGVKMWQGEARKNMVTPEIKSGAEHHNWKGGIAYFKIRAIRLRENGGSHTKGQWETLKAQYNWACPCCKKPEPEIKLVKDHVIPIANGGSDNIQNIQPLCFSCNAKKHTTEIRYEITQYGY